MCHSNMGPNELIVVSVHRALGFADADMTYRLPRENMPKITPEDYICKDTQRTHNQTAGSPRLLARANDTVRLMYQENGHVTKLDPDHPSSGETMIFGLLNSSENDRLLTFVSSTPTYAVRHLGTFDDGYCFENNGSPIAIERSKVQERQRLDIEEPNVWCGQDILLPPTLQAGEIYTLYWVWNFNRLQTAEVYTTCIDIDIVI